MRSRVGPRPAFPNASLINVVLGCSLGLGDSSFPSQSPLALENHKQQALISINRVQWWCSVMEHPSKTYTNVLCTEDESSTHGVQGTQACVPHTTHHNMGLKREETIGNERHVEPRC